MPNKTSHTRSYRDSEAYQLARTLLAEICVSIKAGASDSPHASNLRRTAVALPNVFLPTAPRRSSEELRDSQRIMLQDLAEALGSALESGTLDHATAERLEARRQSILERLDGPPN